METYCFRQFAIARSMVHHAMALDAAGLDRIGPGAAPIQRCTETPFVPPLNSWGVWGGTPQARCRRHGSPVTVLSELCLSTNGAPELSHRYCYKTTARAGLGL